VADDPIDLVLITGAGASRDFGVNQTALPLMAEWCAAITKKLGGIPGFADAVGVRRDMSGPEFEQQLGVFLRAVLAFGQVEPLLSPLGEMLGARAPSTHGNLNNTWNAWHGQATHQINQILAKVYESLYECFAAPNYDPVHVRNAYATLLRQLGIDLESRWVYATTNYDVIADAALESLGFRFDDGTHAARFSGGGPERQFDVGRLVDAVDREVPLLHLHGRVGWLVRSGVGNAGPYAIDNMRAWQDAFGVPLVMLPDPEKDPTHDAILGEMWVEFRLALQRARRILVLGHSLHDAPLTEALIEPAQAGIVGITVLGNPETGELDGDAPQVAERIDRELPGATSIPLRFGRDYGVGNDAPVFLNRWLSATSHPR
jgi:hypothetical protein